MPPRGAQCTQDKAMTEKRLSEGGDEVVLADAAKAEKKLRRRPKQLPALALFVIIAVALAAYKLFISS
jgi:hypothetical protein